ncbi:MAG TPA: substrate-binding domain-containing protein [Capillimicrobium sp.]|nr:substrate-binding domain-containing protein [Capillimicrobium sp.]
MRRLIAMCIVGVLAVTLIACGSGDDDDATTSAPAATEAAATAESGESGETYTIGVANFTLGAPYFIGISETIKAEAEADGNEVNETDARGDAAALTANVDELLLKDVDGIIISGGPLENAPAALNAIKQAGIPVVLVDRKFTGEYTSWVGPDNEAIGRQDGEYIAEHLNGEGKVAIIRGGPADNSIGLARSNGVKSVLEQHPGIEIVTAPDFGEWSSDGGLKVAESLLSKHPDIDVIFCENDSMCLGAQKAVADAGKTDQIILAGVDGQKEALAAIKEGGNYKVTGLNDAVDMGTAAYERLIEILEGGTPEKDTVVPSPQITQENVEEFYDPDSEF